MRPRRRFFDCLWYRCLIQQQRTVLVTGAGGGLGRAISLTFAPSGYNVTVNYAHSEDDAQATAEAVRACGAQAHVLRADVADDAAANRPEGSRRAL